MKAPAKTETRTGTTTASHPDVVVGVVAAGEAAAGTETEGAGLATLATDLPRYENSFDPSTSPVYATRSNGSLSLVFSQCLTPMSLSLSVCATRHY